LKYLAGSVGWIELDVEMVVPGATTWRFLVHGHDIRKGAIEKPVVFLQQALEDARERFVIVVVEVQKPTAMADGREVHLIRPASERWNECDPEFVSQHSALAAALSFEDVAVQAPAGLSLMARLCRELALNDRRHEWVGVDLSMRMAERDADCFTSVLEDIDVAHIGKPTELVGAVPPDFDEVSNVIDALLSKR
jgi:hypothetical protein